MQSVEVATHSPLTASTQASFITLQHVVDPHIDRQGDDRSGGTFHQSWRLQEMYVIFPSNTLGDGSRSDPSGFCFLAAQVTILSKIPPNDCKLTCEPISLSLLLAD
jgi:hypothetical protein